MSVSRTTADTEGDRRHGLCRDRALAVERGPGEILMEVEHQDQPSWEPPAHPRADIGAQTLGLVCKCLDTGLVSLLKRWREPLWWMIVNWMKKLSSFWFLPIFSWSIILTSISSKYHQREPLIGIETEKQLSYFWNGSFISSIPLALTCFWFCETDTDIWKCSPRKKQDWFNQNVGWFLLIHHFTKAYLNQMKLWWIDCPGSWSCSWMTHLVTMFLSFEKSCGAFQIMSQRKWIWMNLKNRVE